MRTDGRRTPPSCSTIQDPIELADELDESLLNQHLNDDEIAKAARQKGTDGVYPDDGGDVDIDRVRRHLDIVEADMLRHWEETAANLEAIADSSTDDFLIFRSERRESFVRNLFEFEVDEGADCGVLARLLGKVAYDLRDRGDTYHDMMIPLPEDVDLEAAEELVAL